MYKRDKSEFDILARIDEEKNRRGWTEYQLAVNSELTQSTISTWRNRGLQPSVASIEKICSGLGISLSEFFNDSREKMFLSVEQKRLLDGWGRLNPEQKAAVINLLDSFTA